MGAFNGILYIGYTWTCSLLDLCLDPWKKMARNQFFLHNRDSLSCDSCQLFPAFHKVMEQSETWLSCKWVQGDWYLSVQSICHSRWNLSSITTVCWSSSYISFPAECDMAGECTSALPHQLPRLLLPLHIKKLREFFTVRLNSTCFSGWKWFPALCRNPQFLCWWDWSIKEHGVCCHECGDTSTAANNGEHQWWMSSWSRFGCHWMLLDSWPEAAIWDMLWAWGQHWWRFSFPH